MLDPKMDFSLVIDIGDLLSQHNLVSAPAFLSALQQTAQQHGDVHSVLLVCQDDRYFRWVVKDLVLYHYRKQS